MQTFDTECGCAGLAICFNIHTILEKYEPHKIWALLYPIARVDDEHPADWLFEGFYAGDETVTPGFAECESGRRFVAS